MSASTGLRFINLNEVLLQISDKIDPDELERLKKLCYELQDGTNPLAISRRELADVKEAFDLFVLQYDHHKNTFLRNVISLVDRLRNSSKAAELTNLVFCWILRKTSIGKCGREVKCVKSVIINDI